AHRLQIIARTDGFAENIQVNRAENGIIRLVAGPDVLDESGVRIRPRVILLPTEAGIPPCDLDERNKSLLVQVIDLPIDVAEIGRVDPVHIREHVLIARDLAWEKKRPGS